VHTHAGLRGHFWRPSATHPPPPPQLDHGHISVDLGSRSSVDLGGRISHFIQSLSEAAFCGSRKPHLKWLSEAASQWRS
jgi:hypothetical protein